MIRLKLAIAAVLIAGIATAFVVQHQTRNRLRDEQNSLQEQLERLVQLETDNERLSNLLAQANNSLSNDQLKDLLRLRGEVGSLRRLTNELQTLREQNQQLRAGLKAGDNAQATRSPPEPFPQDHHPRELWAFDGYATPEAALQSLTWALSKGDVKTFMAGLAPEMQIQIQKEINGKSESASFAEMAAGVNEVTGYRIVAKELVSADEVVITAARDGSNSEDKMTFKRIDGQWKLAPE